MRASQVIIGRYKVGLRVAYIALLALMLMPAAKAQTPNSWINFGQTYYKVRVGANGIHRLTYADLQVAGVPVGSIDPRRLNLYHRGVEQAIIVTGQNDAVFDPTDVIEFYGKRNDGTRDAELYDPPTAQPHTFHNLYSDTAAYFLTWNPLAVPGKRMATFFEVNSSGLPVEAAHESESLTVFTSEFSVVGEPQPTRFTEGEAWTGTTICTVSGGCFGQQDFIIQNLSGGVSTAGNPSMELIVAGREETDHNVEIYVGQNAGSLRLANQVSFDDFETPTLSIPLTWTDIGSDGKMTVRVRIVPTPTRDVVSVSYIQVRMPQNFDGASTNNKTFNLVPNPGGKSYIEIQNPVASARFFDITDADNVRIIGTLPAGGSLGAVVSNTVSGRRLIMTNSAITPPLRRVSFRQVSPALHNYLIISHPRLMKPALGYPDAVKAYAEYRASAAGGGFDTLTVAMDQLYDQFNYGEISPLAIYEFMKFMDAGGDPQFLFLLGKGLEITFNYHRKVTHAPGDYHDLVPPAGIPASDMAFTAGLSGSQYEPGIPVGRLTASTADEVAAYLNKVKEADALAFNATWRKDLLHLSGGIQVGEPQLFRSFVDGFKTIAEGHYLGAKVETISKQTLNVELINIKDQINKGLSLVTFYGHSGPGTIDIDIGYASDPVLGYQNAGKYPGFLINGCNAGRFFDNRMTFGEDWVLTPNKGAKSFIAHSSFGFSSALVQYSNLFYEVAYGDSTFIHKGIGEVQKETARRFLSLFGNTNLSISQVQQMVLLGDPAVSLFGANRPDYEINAGAVSVASFDGSTVTAQADSFAIEFTPRNFGRTEPVPLKVRVRRTLGDASVVDYDSIFSPLMYSETFRFVIRRGPGNSEAGNNIFTLILDPDGDADELLETNNQATINFFIPTNGSKNLFPPRFAIVSNQSVDLTFQHANLVEGQRDFIIEVDTASSFASPYLNRTTLHVTGLGKKPVTVLANDSLVYYWRTRLANPLPGESTEWTTSSFTYISGGGEGWTQRKFAQHVQNDTVGLSWNYSLRRLEFESTVTDVDVLTYGWANPNSPSAVSLKINGDEWNITSQGQQCRNNTTNLLAFDKFSTAPYAGIPFSLFDQRTCGREPQMINSFNWAEMDFAVNGIAQWVANIGEGDSVVIFSIGDADYALWSAATKNSLSQLGIGTTQLDVLQPGEPFVLLAKKGATPGSAVLIRSTGTPANAQSLAVSTSVTGRNASGSLSTDVIGPATAWNSLTLDATYVTPADSVSVNVYGVTLLGTETLLKNLDEGVSMDLSGIDAAQYPWIRLVLHTIDSTDLTPVQLRQWLVTYTSAAEGVLVYKGPLDSQHLDEGEIWSGAYGFVNFGQHNFPDSLIVRTDVFTRASHTLNRTTIKIHGPAPGDTTNFEVTVDTSGKGGLNDVTVFVNPRTSPEMYYDNNILPLYEYLDVKADETGPVLDVTFDGRHISNGDFVSSNPQIVARVVDRNPFLLKSDTTGINLYVQFPCADIGGCAFQRINFTDPGLAWTPATAADEFKLTYRPSLVEGSYILQMDATDANGNSSGQEPYKVEFQVSSEEAFQLRTVFPNPSSDRFIVRLFINDILPDDFRLDVFNTTGQPVQSFGNESLSALRVGTNDLTISATDVRGNPLPPGIYLFRITASISGKIFEESGRLVVSR